MTRKVLILLAGIAVSIGLLAPIPLAAQTTPSATRALPETPVAPGGSLEVTITLSGHGNFADVAETLPAGFTYVSSDVVDDQVTTAGQVVTFALLNRETSITYTVDVDAATTDGDYSFSGELSGVDTSNDPFRDIVVGGDSAVTVAAGTTPTPEPTVEPSPTPSPTTGPSATRSFDETLVAPGDPVEVTITLSGHGNFADVAETLPAGFVYVSSSVVEDQVTVAGQDVTFALLNRETSITYTVTASDAEGNFSFTGELSGVDADNDPFSNITVGGDSAVTVEDDAALRARRSFASSSVSPGGSLVVTITPRGHGNFADVAETLPAGFTYVIQ